MNFLIELLVSEHTAKAMFGDFSLIAYEFQRELDTEDVELAVIVSKLSTADPIIKVTCFTTHTGEYTEAIKRAWSNVADILRGKTVELVIWGSPKIWFLTGSPE